MINHEDFSLVSLRMMPNAHGSNFARQESLYGLRERHVYIHEWSACCSHEGFALAYRSKISKRLMLLLFAMEVSFYDDLPHSIFLNDSELRPVAAGMIYWTNLKLKTHLTMKCPKVLLKEQPFISWKPVGSPRINLRPSHKLCNAVTGKIRTL